jgi:hypothetical protein
MHFYMLLCKQNIWWKRFCIFSLFNEVYLNIHQMTERLEDNKLERMWKESTVL